MRFRHLLPLAITIALAAGCGNSEVDTEGSTPKSVDSESAAAVANVSPCQLVTQAEAEAAYGGPLAPATESNELVKTCMFGSTGGTSFADNVQVQVQSLSIFDGSKAVPKGDSATYGYTITPIAGVGEEAFLQESTVATGATPLVMLAFKKHGVAIYTSVSKKGFTIQQATDAARQLAEKAEGRL